MVAIALAKCPLVNQDCDDFGGPFAVQMRVGENLLPPLLILLLTALAMACLIRLVGTLAHAHARRDGRARKR